MFIVFEGGEGSGKSTQARMLFERLSADGKDAFLCREPGGNPISERIRSILLDRENGEMAAEAEALLYAASRAQTTARVIRPRLEAGIIVICDRFVDSSVAYQGYARGLGAETVRNVNTLATGGLKPDITFFMDIQPENAAPRLDIRGARDRLEGESPAFHRAVYAGYRRIIADNPAGYVVIDAAAPAPEIADMVYAHISELLKIENR